MKRSEINAALKELEAMCQKYSCFLPPFCHFTPEDRQEKGHEYDEVRECMLGWAAFPPLRRTKRPAAYCATNIRLRGEVGRYAV